MTTSATRAMPATPMCRLALLCAALGAAAAPVTAQEQGSAPRQFSFVPSVRLTETITDNARLASSSQAQSEWITQVYPSLRLDANSARMKGNLNIGVNSTFYGNGTRNNTNQFLANGSGTIVAWENRAFVDLLASVSRQPIYAFRPVGADSTLGSNNWSEVRYLTASPYIKERFAGTGTVEARYTLSESDSSSTVARRMVTNQWTLNASDPRALGALGWGLSFSDSHTERSNSRDVEVRSVRFSATYAIDPQLTLRAIGGTESNNYQSASDTSNPIYGGGVDWNPTVRTKVSGTVEHRFFGTGYNINADHRDAQLAFQGAYSKGVRNPGQSILSSMTLYDSLFASFMASPSMIGLFPNAAERAVFLKALIDTSFPGAHGQYVPSNGFYIDRRLQIGGTYFGARNSISLMGFRSDRAPLTESEFALTEDLRTSSNIRTVGLTLLGQHRLTPITSANMSISTLRSHTGYTSTSSSSLDSRSRIITLGLATNLAPRTTASVKLRNSNGSGATSYTENALIGSILIQF